MYLHDRGYEYTSYKNSQFFLDNMKYHACNFNNNFVDKPKVIPMFSYKIFNFIEMI